uniref:Uncharacterized protein n=1 Tax=Paramormyrops kingsleyae TaxID=1676925 RepID=A0A3B3RL00_9TELE
ARQAVQEPAGQARQAVPVPAGRAPPRGQIGGGSRQRSRGQIGGGSRQRSRGQIRNMQVRSRQEGRRARWRCPFLGFRDPWNRVSHGAYPTETQALRSIEISLHRRGLLRMRAGQARSDGVIPGGEEIAGSQEDRRSLLLQLLPSLVEPALQATKAFPGSLQRVLLPGRAILCQEVRALLG